eukprot:271682-Amphidinium_carterae.1
MGAAQETRNDGAHTTTPARGDQVARQFTSASAGEGVNWRTRCRKDALLQAILQHVADKCPKQPTVKKRVQTRDCSDIVTDVWLH